MTNVWILKWISTNKYKVSSSAIASSAALPSLLAPVPWYKQHDCEAFCVSSIYFWFVGLAMALTWPFHCDLILQHLLYSPATRLLYPNIVHVVALQISNIAESISHLPANYPKLPSEKGWRSIQEKIGTILGLIFVPTCAPAAW